MQCLATWTILEKINYLLKLERLANGILHKRIAFLTNPTIFFIIVDIRDTIYTDQTGQFTCTSKRGHNYLVVTHAYDINAILVRPLKTRKVKELVCKLSEINEHLEERGYEPNHQFLDNEKSQEMKSYLIGKDVTF